jgi:hypothetical protein
MRLIFIAGARERLIDRHSGISPHGRVLTRLGAVQRGRKTIQGHADQYRWSHFRFRNYPQSKGHAFAGWDGAPSARLLTDPLVAKSSRSPQPIPAAWREFLAGRASQQLGGWTFYDAGTAYRTTIGEGEFVILAERAGDGFVLHRIEPAAADLFYLASHDGTPEPIRGSLDEVFEETGKGGC